MSKRAIWGLFAVVVALIAYIFIFERSSITSGELIERKARALPTFVRDRVTEFDIERGGDKLVLKRVDLEQGDLSPWLLGETGKVEADQDAVDAVLGELEWLSARRTLTDVTDKDLKQFGLDKPRGRIGYKVGSARYVVALGSSDVHDENVYARLDDETTVLVVPKTVVEALDHDRDHFRSKRFLESLTLSWVPEARVTHKGVEHVVQKEGERWWYMTGMKSHANVGQVQRLLNTVEQLRATRFVPDAPPIAEPAIRVVVREVPPQDREDKKPRQVELLIGGPCPGHEKERLASAADSSERVCVKAEDVKVFEQAEYLRDHDLLPADPSQVESIHLDVGGTERSIKRDEEKWVSVGSSDLPLDREAVEAWLNDVQAIQSSLFEPLPADFAPIEVVRFGLLDDQSRTLALGPPDAREMVKVRRDDEPLVIVISATDAQRLHAIPERFASLTLWPDVQPSQVQAIHARIGSHDRTLTLVDEAWTPKKGPKVTDPQRIRRLVRDVLKTRAISRVGDQALPAYQLDSPQALVELTLAGGDTLRLAVGKSSSAVGLYARSETGAVFEVDASLLRGQLEELAGAPAKPEQADDSGELELDEHGHHEH